MHLPRPESFNRHTAVPAARSLSPLEHSVVLLARRDADRGTILPRLSGLAKLMTLLTGVEGPQPLADDRLETLRRFVGFERRGDRRAGDMAASLIDLGFSPEALAGASALARA